jgi:CRISPR-associated protein Csm4
MMKLLRYELEVKSPLATPMHSDTLGGYLVWLAGLLLDSQKLHTLVKDFRDAHATSPPPFVVSDALPQGYFPRPFLPPVRPEREEPLMDVETARMRKKLRKVRWIKKNLWEEYYRYGKIPSDTQIEEAGLRDSDVWVRETQPHAALNRISHRTEGGADRAGQLFESEILLPSAKVQRKLNVYVLVRDDYRDLVAKLFDVLQLEGFGADRTSGCGDLCVTRQDEMDVSWLQRPEPEQGGQQGEPGFMLLSTFIPAVDDPSEGWWRVRTKYGRVGFASPGRNPFKKPWLALVGGSCFKEKNAEDWRPWRGRVLENLSQSDIPDLVIGYSIVAGCVIPSAEGKEK